jgi:hypothetical protein
VSGRIKVSRRFISGILEGITIDISVPWRDDYEPGKKVTVKGISSGYVDTMLGMEEETEEETELASDVTEFFNRANSSPS